MAESYHRFMDEMPDCPAIGKWNIAMGELRRSMVLDWQ